MKRLTNLLVMIVMAAACLYAQATEGTVLTVNVDDASQVELKIGTSPYFSSSYNRTVELTDGTNTITCNAGDKYVLVSSTALWTPLHKVTFNGHNLTCDEEWVYGAIIPASGGTMDIIAKEPDADLSSFKAYVDAPTKVKYLTRYPGNQDMTVKAGENIYTFKDGDYFQAICYSAAAECTLDGAAVEGTSTNDCTVYTFTPKPDSRFVLNFSEGGTTPSEQATFTLYVDDISKLKYFTLEGNPETELLGTIADGKNTIEFVPGSRFSIWPAYGCTPSSVTIDGKEIARSESINAYYFTPSDGSVVYVLFNGTASEDEYTVKVTFTNAGTEGFVRFAQIDERDVQVQDFIGGLKVAKGSQIWLSYLRYKYDINAITVNGTSMGPNYTGAILFNVYQDTEIVFDVTKPSDINYTIKVDDASHLVAYTGDYYDQYNMDSTIDLYTGVNQLTTQSNKADIHLAPTAGYSITGVSDADGTKYKADEDGVYTVTVTEGMVLTVTTGPGGSDGLTTIFTDDVCGHGGNIYNMQGILIMAGASAADIKSLPQGLYIINGKKVMLRH